MSRLVNEKKKKEFNDQRGFIVWYFRFSSCVWCEGHPLLENNKSSDNVYFSTSSSSPEKR